MALFNAEELLAGAPEEKEFTYTFSRGGEKYGLTLVVHNTKEIRETERAARKKFIRIEKSMKTKGKDKNKIKEESNLAFIQFCQAIIDKAYARSSGNVLDIHNKETILALIEKMESFALELAGELETYYTSGDAFVAKEDEEEKKS